MMWWNILCDLPKDRFEPYRGALTRLAMQPSEAEAAMGLPHRSAAEMLEFLDASHASQAWVPRNKSDQMSIRSLDLLVQTPEEMRPFVPGLLEWLQDPNWPPYSTCWSQLERFPEVAIDPIREVLRRGDDGWWEDSLLQFFLDGVFLMTATGRLLAHSRSPHTREGSDPDVIRNAAQTLSFAGGRGESAADKHEPNWEPRFQKDKLPPDEECRSSSKK
ncbi:hypothetical protein FB451DRAFT_1562097 [Mycena latifolia]|nr:hypothetical protein FB451DRAFT_1562097 [Mycena latifolia]